MMEEGDEGIYEMDEDFQIGEEEMGDLFFRALHALDHMITPKL
jgi:hypothetical protein